MDKEYKYKAHKRGMKDNFFKEKGAEKELFIILMEIHMKVSLRMD